jgi:hypothetical protein
MDEHLVGYLLNALDPVTHARVRAHLEHDPDARARLGLLEQALAPLAEDADEEPPPGLAELTLARLAGRRGDLPAAPQPSPHQRGLTRRRLRFIDALAAACLLVVVAGVGVPVLARQWQQQRRLACENNLRKFWVGLQAYADRSDNEFPRVEAQGPRAVAGVFVPEMTDCGLLADVSVTCPAQEQRAPGPYTVAELEQLYEKAPERYRAAARTLAGDYAYCLGYQDGRAHRGLGRDSGDGLPILADCGGDGGNSANHGGAGQNVLYVGGNVRWCVQPNVGLGGDDIYVNHHFRVGAGLCQTDTVLAPSGVRPY